MPDSSELFPGAHPARLRRVFERTEIRRAPLTGIVRGYHTLPFSLVGPDDGTTRTSDTSSSDAPEESIPESATGAAGAAHGSVLLTGKISVSPRLIIPVAPDGESFGDAFPEEEPFMDPGLVGRVFAFAVGKGRGLRVRNEHLTVETFADSDTILLERVLDDLERSEIIDRAVIWCPEPRFYPVSLEKFILSVLEREFR
jgi:hypothetical protein